MAKVKVTVNGREVLVEEGLNMIEAARKAGVEIPHFCYHPGLGVDGNCRMCLCEVEGVGKPQIACNTFAKDGVKIHTDTPRVKELQAAVLEFLFLNHPLDCPICDQSGECYLQDYYMSNGQYQSRLDTEKVHKRKVISAGPRVTLDAERCVLCSRCVRFCDSVTGTGELYIVNRGNRSEITTYPGKPLDNDYSLNTVDLCPVGALTNTDFRFRKRVWFLKTVDSICAGCSRGCNVYIEEDEGVVYRYRPRENMEVNRYWMCDPGRETVRAFNVDRLDVALAGEEMLPCDQALTAFGRALESAGRGAKALVLVSPASSLETLHACKSLLSGLLSSLWIGGVGTRPPSPEDRILRRADPYPNTEGLRLLGLEKDPETPLSEGGALLVIVEDDPLAHRPAWREHFGRWKQVIYLGTNENETSRASHMALPITPHSECDGTFVNFDRRVQRFHRSVQPRGDALWGPELLRRVAEGLGTKVAWDSLEGLWLELRSIEPALSEVDFAGLESGGTLTSARRVATSASIPG